MAFWGAPLKDDKQALNAVRCALAMHGAIDGLCTQWRRDFKDDILFRLGIGVHTGKVVVGNIGSEKYLSYTVIGDNVNLASRIEGLTRHYRVHTLIGERTEELIRPWICCRVVESRVVVKGKQNYVKLFEPLCERSSPYAKHCDRLAQRFEEAMALYEKGQFEWARTAFAAIEKELAPGDGPCGLYLERCKDLIASPPDHWDGVYVAKSK
jgi:adenylate cyclase